MCASACKTCVIFIYGIWTSLQEILRLTSLLGDKRREGNGWLVGGAHDGSQVCWLGGKGLGAARSRWGDQGRIESGGAWRQGRLLREVDTGSSSLLCTGAHAIVSNSSSWWPVHSTWLLVWQCDHVFGLSLGNWAKCAPIDLTSRPMFYKKEGKEGEKEGEKNEEQRKEER